MGFFQWVSDKAKGLYQRLFGSPERTPLMAAINESDYLSTQTLSTQSDIESHGGNFSTQSIEENPASPPPESSSISIFGVLGGLGSLIFTKANAPRITLSLLLSVANTGFNFLAPYLFGELIKLLSSTDEYTEIAGVPLNRAELISLLVSVYTLTQVIPNVREQLVVPVSAQTTADLIKRDTEHLLNKSLHSYNTDPFSDKLFLFQRSFFVVKSSAAPLFTQMIPTALEVAAAAALLAESYDLTIGLGVVGLLVLYTGYSALTAKPLVTARGASLTAGNEIYQAFSSALMNYKSMRDFGKFDHTMKKMMETLDNFAKAEINSLNTPLRISLGHYGLSRVGMLLASVYVGLHVKSGQYNIQDFVLLIGYLIQLSNSLPAFGLAINEFVASYPDLKLVFNELAKPDEVVDLHPNVPLPLVSGIAPSIEFKDVWFSYPAKPGELANPDILKGANFKINAGEKVALLSKSGAGKSTIFNLLYRYYNPRFGTIKINGKDITEVSLKSLQNNIGLLGQDANLFKGTVRENIRYGSADPDNFTDEMIWELAENANLATFLSDLSQELDTDVGEEGKALSGGQQQKVAILRGLVKKASIRLLDEVTAPLDSKSATEVLQGMSDSSQGVTTLMITHKLPEAQTMDRIIFIDGGKILAQGTHDELLVSCELYANLWQAYMKQQADAGDVADSSVTSTSTSKALSKLGKGTGKKCQSPEPSPHSYQSLPTSPPPRKSVTKDPATAIPDSLTSDLLHGNR